MASTDHNRYDDSEDEDDFNPAPADLSDEEPDQDAGDRPSDARESSPAADDDDAAVASKPRRVDDDEDEEQDEEEGGAHDDEEEEDEDDEDEDDVQQVSFCLRRPPLVR